MTWSVCLPSSMYIGFCHEKSLCFLGGGVWGMGDKQSNFTDIDSPTDSTLHTHRLDCRNSPSGCGPWQGS